MFVKYQHVERYGTDETENINFGKCYVFPKIDGTNGSVYLKDGVISAGSRRLELSIEKDNHGFYNNILTDGRYNIFFEKNPELRLYGEWLVPHSLKTYNEKAWRKFYIFDVMKGEEYLTYDEYKPILEDCLLEFIPCIAIINNGTYEQFINLLEKTNYLIKDGEGLGEGIVIKNYDYVNKYGRKTWAKIVRSEFKEKHSKEMGAPEMAGKKIIEDEIVGNFLTESLIEKTFDKIKNESGWSSKKIPELLNRIWHDFITEDLWDIIKKYNNPKIDFKTLQYLSNKKIKEIKNELF